METPIPNEKLFVAKAKLLEAQLADDSQTLQSLHIANDLAMYVHRLLKNSKDATLRRVVATTLERFENSECRRDGTTSAHLTARKNVDAIKESVTP